jgi:hypothetical protein
MCNVSAYKRLGENISVGHYRVSEEFVFDAGFASF